jgi:hypothetical protein
MRRRSAESSKSDASVKPAMRTRAQLKGLQGWQGPGWTAPDPGSRHYPEVRGGAVIALFYLPAGRISYDFKVPA